MTGTWAAGWATNDLVSAAEFAKGLGNIYDTTLGVGAASIDAPSLTGVYAHLLVVAYLRSDNAALGLDCIVRLNGDSGTNYRTTNAALQSSMNTNANGPIPGANNTAGFFGSVAILIPHYANTANHKSILMLSGDYRAAVPQLSSLAVQPGAWQSTAAINRITVSASAGNIVTGSRLSIYALGA